jgi:hypothetical protein
MIGMTKKFENNNSNIICDSHLSPFSDVGLEYLEYAPFKINV